MKLVDEANLAKQKAEINLEDLRSSSGRSKEAHEKKVKSLERDLKERDAELTLKRRESERVAKDKLEYQRQANHATKELRDQLSASEKIIK